MRTPAGTIPAVKLVRAFQEARTVLPNGSFRFSSKPVQDVLEPYSEQLKQAAAIEKKRKQVHWSLWEGQGLADNGWIQFRHVLNKLMDTFAFTSASS